jgi:glutaminyl-peptide cyclotransferase
MTVRARLAAPLLAASLAAAASAAPAPTRRAEVVRSYPHDPSAFTEGLLYRDGTLYESTGMEGRSEIRQVRISDGRVLRRRGLPPTEFGEGIAAWGGQIVGLTWKDGRGHRWRLSDLAGISTFPYAGEGWGLASAGSQLVMSDGSDRLRFLDPGTFALRRTLRVTDDGRPVDMLNELEWVDGSVYANVWHADRIARIDPASGRVLEWLDLSDVAAAQRAAGPEGVLNGIAWDASGRRMFVTGKNWTRLYEIRAPR